MSRPSQSAVKVAVPHGSQTDAMTRLLKHPEKSQEGMHKLSFRYWSSLSEAYQNDARSCIVHPAPRAGK